MDGYKVARTDYMPSYPGPLLRAVNGMGITLHSDAGQTRINSNFPESRGRVNAGR